MLPNPRSAPAAAARLNRQKVFDLLLRAFSGLAGRTSLPGTLPTLGAVLANSDLFALSSRFEGSLTCWPKR